MTVKPALLYIHVAVPIQKPHTFVDYRYLSLEPFSFDRTSRFICYQNQQKDSYLVCDDHDNWYYFTSFEGPDFNSIRYSRQSVRSPYISEGQTLPLVNELKKRHLQPITDHYDKAYSHASVLVDHLDDFPLADQLKLANVDGNDDPQVVSNIHYIENEYNGLRTRFISGFETKSFATVTENQYYFEHIHLSNVSWIYLQYFLYYQRYNIVPSEQMMPKLLGNLWASTKAFERNWNPSMLKIESVF